MEQTQGAVAEMLEMIPVTRAHGLQEVEIKKMNKHLNQIVRNNSDIKSLLLLIFSLYMLKLQ